MYIHFLSSEDLMGKSSPEKVSPGNPHSLLAQLTHKEVHGSIRDYLHRGPWPEFPCPSWLVPPLSQSLCSLHPSSQPNLQERSS